MRHMVRFSSLHAQTQGELGPLDRSYGARYLSWGILLLALFLVASCGIINPGKWKGIEKTASDEKYYLLEDIFLSSGSADKVKQAFDHKMNPVINLVFIPRNEKNRYVAESVWYDPSGQEYRTIRKTYDIQEEGKKSIDRRPLRGGSTRVHTISTEELYQRKPGLWKVVLNLDGELARRLEFTVR